MLKKTILPVYNWQLKMDNGQLTMWKQWKAIEGSWKSLIKNHNSSCLRVFIKDLSLSAQCRVGYWIFNIGYWFYLSCRVNSSFFVSYLLFLVETHRHTHSARSTLPQLPITYRGHVELTMENGQLTMWKLLKAIEGNWKPLITNR